MQCGHIFERKITERLSDLRIFDGIYHENDLRKRWGWDVTSIDHLLVYKDFYIPIQEKWCNTRRRETKHIQRFLRSIAHVRNIMEGKTLLFGVWVSRIEPFDDNKRILQECNVHSVSCYTKDMDELVARLVECLTRNIQQKLRFPSYGDGINYASIFNTTLIEE